jgi:capsular exopolysaccharide synthesis family protein
LRDLHADPQVSARRPGNEGAFGSYLRAIRAHPLVVALVTVATLLSAVLWLTLRADSYDATAQLLVTPLPQDDQTFLGLQLLRDSGDPTRTVQTAATLVESQQAADRAAQKLGKGWTGEEVLSRVEVEPQGESNVLAVTGRGSSAEEAMRIANEFAGSALAIRNEALATQIAAAITRLTTRLDQQRGDQTDEQTARLEQLEAVRSEGDPTLSLSQPALEGTAVGAGKPVVLFLALLAGLALGSVAAILMEMADRRVRTEDELLRLFPLPILARVPLYSRRQWTPSGASQNGLPWQMPPGVREGFRTLVAQLEDGSSQRGKAIMITSASTGDGKTTSAINLAVSLAAGGESVVLFDSDIRKPNVGTTIGVSGTSRLQRLLSESSSLEGFLRPAPHLPSLSVLALGAGEGDTALVEAMNRRLPQLIEEARQRASYVVVDTAPLGEVSDALHIAGDVDDIVIVTRPGHSNRTHLITVRDLLSRTGHMAAGFLVIGNTPGTSAASSYYGYGYGAAAPPLAGHPGDSAA